MAEGVRGQPGDEDLHACFIIHSALPYCYDLNQVLALPTGFRYRNRFQAAWVDPNLRGNMGTLAGKRVLIVLRDRDRNLLIPVRWGLLDVAQQVGSVYYFEYVLGEVIDYPGVEAERSVQIQEHTRVFGNHHPHLPGTAGQDLAAPSVFLSSAGASLPTASADDLSHWGNAVAAVSSAAIYEKVEFLKVVDIRTFDGVAAPLRGEHFEVAPDTVYALHVFQTIPRVGDGQVEPHDITLQTFPDHIATLRGTQRAVGKYDMLTFVLKVKELPPGERTSIEIPYSPHPERGKYAPTSLYIPMIVRPKSRLRSVLRLGIVATALTFMFGPQLLPGNEETIRNVATVVFVLVVAGTPHLLKALWPHFPFAGGKPE